MLNKFQNRTRSGVTLVEMIVTVFIVSLLMGYAWKIWSGGRSTMTHTVSQSQLQAETRWFFDQLSRDISGAYRFKNANPAEKKFCFYSFMYARKPLDFILYDDKKGGAPIAGDEQTINVRQIEYIWNADGTVLRKQTPGYLAFQKNPPEFKPGNASDFAAEDQPSEKTMLHNIVDFEFKPYFQEFIAISDATGKVRKEVKITSIDGTKPQQVLNTSFISLRIHNKIDEKGDRRDEEIDVVGKFYSRVRLAEVAYPGYFCSTDQDGEF